MLRALDLSAEEKAAIRYLSFLTLKPTMYIANVNEDGFENNPYLDQVREIAAMLTINDAPALIDLVQQGIGPAKSMGCGLLSLAPL